MFHSTLFQKKKKFDSKHTKFALIVKTKHYQAMLKKGEIMKWNGSINGTLPQHY